MGKYAHYDPKESVIFVDYSELILNQELMQAVFDETIELAKSLLPKRFFVVACFKNTHIHPSLSQEFGKSNLDLLKHVRGIVRYDTNIAYTNITIRVQTVKQNLQGTQSHLYKTKEAALAAVRKLELETEQA